jgi:multidrug resistance protein, MATE family
MSHTAPLLESKDWEARKGWRLEKLVDIDEAKGQLLFALPMILTSMSYYAITLVSVMFAGHIGDTELAGATLGNSWGTVTGLALMVCTFQPDLKLY